MASGEAIMGGENPIGTMDLTTIAGGYGPMAISPCRLTILTIPTILTMIILNRASLSWLLWVEKETVNTPSHHPAVGFEAANNVLVVDRDVT